MFLGIATLLIAVIISAVSAYYSVLGLTAIFAAAFWPIVLMGGALETGKIMTAVWLHRNWGRASWAYKAYLVPALVFLMLLTSMGIFGFLSKAHLDQTVPTGDVAAQVALIDEKIKNERETIANARSLIKQLDDAVVGINASADREVKRRDGSTYTQSGAERALAVRRSQARDRASLTKTIDEAQATIVKLQEQKAPIAKELRKVEAEVGPVKYVAAMIYGDNPDTNTLEKAVRWVIILIVLVFDPLAIVLILAGSKQIEWARGINFKQEDHHREVMRQRAIEEEESATAKKEPELGDWTEQDHTELANDLLMSLDKEEQDLRDLRADAERIHRQEQEIADLLEQNKAQLEKNQKIESDLNDAVEIISILEENSQNDSQKINDLSIQKSQLLEQLDQVTAENKALEEQIRILAQQLEEEKNKPAQIVYETVAPSEPVAEPEPVLEVVEVQPEPVAEPELEVQPEPKEEAPVEQPAAVPEFISLVADNDDSSSPTNASFGTKFPLKAGRGDLFLRVDYLPSKLFKWNGNKWIEVDKRLTDSYTYNDQYIKHLISRVKKGEYDIDDLSDNEKSQIDDFLKNNPDAQ